MAETLWKDSDEIFLDSDDIWFDFYLTDTIVDSVTVVEGFTPKLLLLPICINDSVVIVDYVDFELHFLITVYMISGIHTMVLFDSTIPNNQTVVLASGVQKLALYNSWMN